MTASASGEPVVVAASVTYGSRVDLLIQTVETAVRAGVEHVAVIANGVEDETAVQLELFLQTVPVRNARLVRLGRNGGSAVGFASAIQTALEMKADFIWLLDDDSVVEPEALRLLVDEASRSPDAVALGSFRSTNPWHNRVLLSGAGEANFPQPGSYMYFDLRRRIRGPGPTRPPSVSRALPIRLPYGPYGGLFMSRSAVEMVGAPRADFVLYEDDTEYTSRFAAHGIDYRMCPGSVIGDGDRKWFESDGQCQGSGPSQLLASGNNVRLFYSVRNRTYFDRLRAVGLWPKMIFFLNLGIYLIVSFVTALRLKRVRAFAIFVKAVGQGLRGHLGVGPELT